MKSVRRALMQLSLGLITAAHFARYCVSFFTKAKGRVAGVRVIVVRDREVLLLSHWFAPFVWTLPGGGIDDGETPEEAGIREVREETGLEIGSIAGTVGTYKGKMGKNDTVTVLYTGDFSGSLQLYPNLEIMGRSWFNIDNLPDEVSPANRRRIEAYRAGVRNEQDLW